MTKFLFKNSVTSASFRENSNELLVSRPMSWREPTTLWIKKKKKKQTKEKASGWGGSLDFYSSGSVPLGTHWYYHWFDLHTK